MENALAINENKELTTATEMPLTKEFLEILKDAQKLESEIDALALETTSPTEMVEKCKQGMVIDVVDCFITEIRDKDELKDVVLFRVVAQGTGEEFSVMQSINVIRQRYAEYFATFKSLGAVTGKGTPRLNGYQFRTDPKYSKMGNDAIVLKPALKALPTTTKTK